MSRPPLETTLSLASKYGDQTHAQSSGDDDEGLPANKDAESQVAEERVAFQDAGVTRIEALCEYIHSVHSRD